jgi:hypothetical protein
LEELFGATIVNKDHIGNGFYLSPQEKQFFKRFDQQTLLFWKFNLGLYNFDRADTALLPIFTPGRPGPPEIIGGHEPTGYKALGIKNHPASKAAILPINLGKLYFLHGYEQHKNILLDVIDNLYPEASHLVRTNAPARMEVIVQNYIKNIPANIGRIESDGMILHLVNLTGFSGNTYFDALPVYDMEFDIQADFKPTKVFGMVNNDPIDFSWSNGRLKFTVKTLGEFEGIVIER